MDDHRDALFAAWSADRQSAAPTALKMWLQQYPEMADDLAHWTADAPVIEAAETCAAYPIAEERALAVGRQVVAEMRAQYSAATAAPLAGIVEAARAVGLTPKALADRLGVGISIVAKLHQRLFAYASLPAELIGEIADALRVNAEQVRAYLNQPPTLARGAQYKADHAPKVAAQEDFQTAIRACREMTAAQQARRLNIDSD